MNCEQTLDQIRAMLREDTQLSKSTGNGCLIRLPFQANDGVPVVINVSTDGQRATIDDDGAVAGLLFSLGQDATNTPAFRLLKDLEQAHGLEIDLDQGLLKISAPEEDLCHAVAELAKVILTIQTVIPHLHTITPHLRPASKRPGRPESTA